MAQQNVVGTAFLAAREWIVSDEVKSRALPVLFGAVVAVLLALAALMFLPERAAPPAPVAEVAEEPATIAAPQAAPAPDAEPEPEPVTAAAPEPMRPSFDAFRVEPNGNMVVAGRAEPGQTVAIVLGGETLEEVVADASGAFVAFPLAGPSDDPRRLSLIADPTGAALTSENTFLVAPIAAPAPVVAEAPPEPATLPEEDMAENAAPDPVATTPEPTAPPAEIASAAPAPAAPVVLETDPDGVRVVQAAPTLDAPNAPENIVLDAITYDPEGEVQISGRATRDGAVQVYIDNEPVTASPVTEGGDWRIDLPDIETGVYTLRIDEVDSAGDVVSRIETPFKREEAADVAAVMAEETARDGFDVAVRTVQPGSTLWAIAEENLGSGIYYVEVFEANRDLIRDPDLIYPGQIFRIPEVTE